MGSETELSSECHNCHMASLKQLNEFEELSNKCKELEKKCEELVAVLEKVFTEDQITFLREGDVHHWSDKTYEKARNLRIACGKKGYDELLKVNLPYPSRRTLDRIFPAYKENGWIPIRDQKCPQCDKTFEKEENLQNHINRIHLGLKEHMCDKCGESFGTGRTYDFYGEIWNH